MNGTAAARQNYATGLQLIKTAKASGKWGLAKSLEKKQAALKTELQDALRGVEPETQREEAQSTPTIPPALNFYLHPASQRAAVFVDCVYNLWLTSGHSFRRPLSAEVLAKYRQILEVVTLNLLDAHVRQLPCVRVRRDEALYRRKSRYRPEVFDKKTLAVFDDLHNMGLVRQVTGDRYQNTVEGNTTTKALHTVVNRHREYKQTELHPTKKFRDLMIAASAFTVGDIAEHTERQEIIVLKKDESSALLEYDETDATRKLRQQMRLINAHLTQAGPLLTPEIKGMTGFSHLDDRHRHLIRRFTYGEFHKGGRLWGGFWQNMPKAQRSTLLRIHGEKTVECDYSGIMPRLAYAFLKIEPPPGDVYAVPGLSPQSRKGIKVLMNCLLMEARTTPRDRFPKDKEGKSVAELFSVEDRLKGYRQIYGFITGYHAGLVPLFGTGIGHSLQSAESTLLVNVLLDLRQRKIVGLPLHDGIIVAESKAELVSVVMEHRAVTCLKCSLPVQVKGHFEGLKGERKAGYGMSITHSPCNP